MNIFIAVAKFLTSIFKGKDAQNIQNTDSDFVDADALMQSQELGNTSIVARFDSEVDERVVTDYSLPFVAKVTLHTGQDVVMDSSLAWTITQGTDLDMFQIKLADYNDQYVYLDKNTQITFFKVVYIRKFIETFELTSDFGKKVTVTITRNGDIVDLIHLSTLEDLMYAYQNHMEIMAELKRFNIKLNFQKDNFNGLDPAHKIITTKGEVNFQADPIKCQYLNDLNDLTKLVSLAIELKSNSQL